MLDGRERYMRNSNQTIISPSGKMSLVFMSSKSLPPLHGWPPVSVAAAVPTRCILPLVFCEGFAVCWMDGRDGWLVSWMDACLVAGECAGDGWMRDEWMDLLMDGCVRCEG